MNSTAVSLTLIVFCSSDNPPAEVTSSLTHYKAFSLQNAYRGESYFWAMSPSVGDHITFNLTPPIVISRFLFRSSNLEHPEDKLPLNSTVELLPVDANFANKSGSTSNDGWDLTALHKTADNFVIPTERYITA